MPRIRILYAEDDPDTRDMICIALEMEGFEVVCPDTPNGFLTLAREQQWDAYMLDTWMPEVSGTELCKKVREFDLGTPIIFYSAAAFEHERKQAMGCGAQAYVTKPASLPDLVKTINSVLA
jgi:DNA-binding response OmpR family regulator